MSLDAGGHLTHGAKPNQSGKWFNAVQYGVRRDTLDIDYDQIETMALEHKPAMIIAGGSAIPRAIDFARIREIADQIGAFVLADVAHFAGLIAADVYPNPFPHVHVATTTTHKTLRGPRGGMILTNDEALAKKFNSAIFPGIQGGPLMHVIAAKAVAFGEALEPSFKSYQQQVKRHSVGRTSPVTRTACRLTTKSPLSPLVSAWAAPRARHGGSERTISAKSVTGSTAWSMAWPATVKMAMPTSRQRSKPKWPSSAPASHYILGCKSLKLHATARRYHLRAVLQLVIGI